MAALEWSDALALDLPLMDDTHREFVDLLAQVEQAVAADLDEALGVGGEADDQRALGADQIVRQRHTDVGARAPADVEPLGRRVGDPAEDAAAAAALGRALDCFGPVPHRVDRPRGEVAEWSIAAVLKTVGRVTAIPGFESLSLRM